MRKPLQSPQSPWGKSPDLVGGTARYHGHDEVRPTLGSGPAPSATDIERAVQLVERGVWCWLIALVLCDLLHA